MAKDKTLYSRRLSLEESRERFIFIQKNALSMFPSPGKSFPATVNEKKADLSLESVYCICRGADKPHYHYHLSFAGLSDVVVRRGSIVRVKKEGENYRIEVR